MTMMTSHPGAKMSNHTQPPAEIAQAAWQAAGIKPKSFGQYKRWWITWEEWCDAECINPLAATNDDFEAFVADQELNAHMRAKYRGLLFQPYRSVGKTNPARRPTSQSKAYIDECAPILKRFQSWCKANNSSYLPARNQDVVAFLTELAKTYSHSYLKQASTAIGRIHIDAGYTPPSREPEVTSALKHLKGTPRQLVTDTNYAESRDRRIAQWTDWCRQHRFEPAGATAEQFLQFLQQLATGLSAGALKRYRFVIARMYADRSITHNPQTQALIDATPTGAERKAERDAARQIIAAEIQWILRTETQLMEPFNSNLSDERRERVALAMAHADVTNATLLNYVRYAWMPFKEWNGNKGTSPETATPSDVSDFLCKAADEKGTSYAHSTFNGLLYVFNRIRPNDNPADFASVRKTLQGLTREKPSPPQQAKPIGTHELAIIVEAAPKRKRRESEDQARLRSAVDIALLRTMHDTGIRGAEAAEVELNDLHKARNGRGGSTLIIRRSKTDQLHTGASLYLTKVTNNAIKDMQHIRQELEIPDDDPRIFRLSKGSIYHRIRAACKHAGLTGRYTMHSLRVGVTQDLIAEGFSDAQIMNVLRWKSQTSLSHYGRDLAAERNVIAQREQELKQDGQTKKRRPKDYEIRPPHSKARLGH